MVHMKFCFPFSSSVKSQSGLLKKITENIFHVIQREGLKTKFLGDHVRQIYIWAYQKNHETKLGLKWKYRIEVPKPTRWNSVSICASGTKNFILGGYVSLKCWSQSNLEILNKNNFAVGALCFSFFSIKQTGFGQIPWCALCCNSW